MSAVIAKALERLEADRCYAFFEQHYADEDAVEFGVSIAKPLAALIRDACKPGRHEHRHHCRVCNSEYSHINEDLLHTPGCALCKAITGE